MRANSKTREPELQAYWAERRIYERLLARNESGGSFVLLLSSESLETGASSMMCTRTPSARWRSRR